MKNSSRILAVFFWVAATISLGQTDEETTAPVNDAMKNIIYNSSFELGADLSEALAWHRMRDTDYLAEQNRTGWAIDTGTACDGKRSLRCIQGKPLNLYAETMDPYPQAGKPWTLSVYLKAGSENTPCTIKVSGYCLTDQESYEKKVIVGTQWSRFQLTVKEMFKGKRRTSGNHQGAMNFSIIPSDNTTLWVDAVQWEPGETPSEYDPSASDIEMVNSVGGQPVFSRTVPEIILSEQNT